ncbi:hypothetical protein M0812_09118 [Anaeramoeba flamelloides]|uniref:Uncharacterized protein n=1 Tax=Anaeramoeba flamelloides TaxID=1746091 RepID=A0AAV7ZQ94_9EUKA|nr:hypothetical protein M0812_09118 [Anaeramoeba flamelloides]
MQTPLTQQQILELYQVAKRMIDLTKTCVHIKAQTTHQTITVQQPNNQNNKNINLNETQQGNNEEKNNNDENKKNNQGQVQEQGQEQGQGQGQTIYQIPQNTNFPKNRNRNQNRKRTTQRNQPEISQFKAKKTRKIIIKKKYFRLTMQFQKIHQPTQIKQRIQSTQFFENFQKFQKNETQKPNYLQPFTNDANKHLL